MTHHHSSTPSTSLAMGESVGGPRGRRSTRGGRRSCDSRNILDVDHPSNYTSVAESLGKPKVLGAYSLDHERDFGHDKSLLHFLAPEYLPKDGEMKVNFDLNKGLSEFNRYAGNTEETFHNFLKWIVYNKDCVVDESLQRFKGSIYMMNPQGLDKLIPGANEETVEKWGHTFEHYMRGGDPEDRIDANEEYRCVLRTVIGGMTVMFSKGVDCADEEQFKKDFEDLSAFLLVKTCTELKDDRSKKSYKYKLAHWWATNQLSGIPRVIVGFQNGGVVHTLKLLRTDELPEIAEGLWDPNVNIHFLVRFLQFVKEKVNKEPGAIYRFDHEKKNRTDNNMYCTKLSDAEAEEVNFLPSWYTQNPFFEEKSDEDSG